MNALKSIIQGTVSPCMADVPTLSPELCRNVSALARTLVAAARSWALYPPDHPAVRGSLERVRHSVAEAADGRPFSFGVTPDTLLIAGVPLTGRDAGAVAEAAAWLHDRDVLELTFLADVTVASLQRLLGVLSEDSRVTRQRGGPAKVWAEQADPSILLEQIDYAHLLEDREVVNPARRKDDLWRAIVRSVLDRRRPMDEATQARMLEISGDVIAIAELARDVIAPHHTPDGSPMVTSQAAAVVAAYRYLLGIVDVLSPERRREVIDNLAAATANLSPHVVMQMLQAPGDAASGSDQAESGAMLTGIVDAFDDAKVAQLLATTLAIEGQASQRLATVFDTIAPDSERKHRVMSLTRQLLREMDFGRQDQFQTLWSSMEELLLSYNERPFVSAQYRAGLDEIGARAEQMATQALPDDLVALIETLGQDNVRRLSVTLLIDLLKLESDPARAPELARDVAALAEDLLLAGDYDSAVAVVSALAEHAANPRAVAYQDCRLALDGLVSTVAFREAAALLEEMSDAEAARFAEVCRHVGPASTDALLPRFESEEATPGRQRAAAIVRAYGVRAVTRLGPLVSSNHWPAQRNAAQLLGDIGVAESVPLLQPLLRGVDARVIAAAVRALAGIKDPSAARCVHTVLRASSGEQRRAVVDALVSERDARVVPVLVRILDDSDPFGADHVIVLETLAALAQVGDDHAVPALTSLMRRKKLLARRKVRAVKTESLSALRAIRTPAAERAITEAAANGDRLLRRLARASQEAHG
jgi:HEAT repeat protein